MIRRSFLAALSFTVLAGTTSIVSGASTAFADTATDVAPFSSITTDTTGPADAQFQKFEATYNAPFYGSDAWHGFCRQNGRDIVISLPQNYNIQNFSIEMEQNPSSGVYYPNHVDFEVNVNGSWYKMGTAKSGIPSTDKRLTTQTFAVNGHNVQGGSFRIRFPVAVVVFVRHIHIMATPSSGSAQMPSLPADPVPYNNPLSADDARAHGIRNMLLVFTGANGQRGTWSQSDFLPMIAYTPQNGQAVARMFDSMLFSPYGTMTDTQTGWQAYLQDLFTQGQQLSALDAAVAQQNQALGTPGYKEKVMLTLPYPAYGDGVWGQANGKNLDFNGSNSDPNALSVREAALAWYLQTLMGDWNSAQFQNLQFTGLYWQNEQVGYDRPGEVSLIQNAAELTHQNGFPLFWIPFYDASGVDDWQSAGFDAAYLQPNLIEQGAGADTSRLQNTEQYASQNGLGLEIELIDGALYNTGVQSQYFATLNQFAQDHFAGNIAHTYYAGSKLLVEAANSTNPWVHNVYDQTYQFISHP